MGRLLDGKWITHDLGTDAQGRYVRRATQFRNTDVTDVVAGRYILILASACGWSHRTMLVRALQGLEEAIPVVICDAFMGEQGWTIERGISGETLFQEKAKQEGVNVKTVHDLYVLAQSDYTGRASVPVLWDTKEGTIVNNESSDIVKLMLNSSFAPLAKTPNPHIMPAANQELSSSSSAAQEKMIQANYGPINNGVYRCGFASNQQAYQESAVALFERLDQLEELLGQQRYLMGNEHATLADLCLFPTLYRFDHVYYTHFKCNKKHIYEYPNLWGWTREIYQMPGVKETCHMDHIREHYYTSHESVHPRRFIPLGPHLNFVEPHGRDEKQYSKTD
jgi:putative glutathione S-transferase